MKNLIVLVIIFLNPFGSESQSKIDTGPLLFREFVPAKVLMKSGAVENPLLNYNTNNQSIVFIKENQILELTNLNDIQEIAIYNSVFIPMEGKFYERIDSVKNLFIYFANKKISKANTFTKSGHSVVQDAEASNNVSDIYLTKKYNRVDDVKYVKYYSYLDNGKMHPINNINDVAKIFKLNKKDVIQFAKSNKIDFNYTNDIIRILRNWNKL